MNKWNLMPSKVDVLITHTPPLGFSFLSSVLITLIVGKTFASWNRIQSFYYCQCTTKPDIFRVKSNDIFVIVGK